ncbi:hypothetical protein H0H87_004144 [Tephrocybe sp. NHM501043]|nr:hypothetical protein H0H87_004144 [Tephrocybe sp. NHM501043]
MALTVPLIGRLSLREYSALVAGLAFVVFEALLHVVVALLPTPIIRWFYKRSRFLFNSFSPSSPAPKAPKSEELKAADRVLKARDLLDLCAIYGYSPEEHVVLTKDGYLLGLHRLPAPKGEVRMGPNTSTGKPVVYLHHGLLMNSEVWVCLTDAQRALPFVLAEQGYDVWLGNNRGNKYSKKSIHNGPNSTKFWDYSIDDFAWHDIPDSIEYILDITKSAKLSYIGFSQGTAQAFAALSIHPQLNEKIHVFIALAPALSPAGLAANIVDGLMKASPTLLFLFFGRKAILSSATMWQSIVYPPIFAKVIDHSLVFLFNWRSLNITRAQKIAAYAHLYSFASVKSIVHWFQIMRNGAFQMYDDDTPPVLPVRSAVSAYRPARFPTRNIAAPVVLMYGDIDSLVDIDVMRTQLPPHTLVHRLHGYEHLDVLWGKDVHKDVIPHVLDYLKQHQEGTEGVFSIPSVDARALLAHLDKREESSTVTTESPSEYGTFIMMALQEQSRLHSLSTELILVILEYLPNPALVSIAKASRDLHYLALPIFFARHGIECSSELRALVLHEKAVPALPGLRAALFISSVDSISCKFQGPEELHFTWGVVELLRFIHRLNRVSRLSLNVGNIDTRWVDGLATAASEAWKPGFIRLMDTAIERGCVSLTVANGHFLVASSLLKEGARLEGPDVAPARTFMGLPLPRRKQASRAQAAPQNKLTSFSVHSNMLLSPPFYEWTLQTLHSSPITSLSLRISGISQNTWPLVLDAISLPLLTSFAAETTDIAFPALLHFLKRHVNITTLVLHSHFTYPGSPARPKHYKKNVLVPNLTTLGGSTGNVRVLLSHLHPETAVGVQEIALVIPQHQRIFQPADFVALGALIEAALCDITPIALSLRFSVPYETVHPREAGAEAQLLSMSSVERITFSTDGYFAFGKWVVPCIPAWLGKNFVKLRDVRLSGACIPSVDVEGRENFIRSIKESCSRVQTVMFEDEAPF